MSVEDGIEDLHRFRSVFRCKVGVAHGHIDRAMADELLDSYEVNAVRYKVGCERMTAVVKPNIL